MFLAVILLILDPSSFILAQEPPILGQPRDYSGAVGSFHVTMRATPTEVAVEQPLRLTVRVQATRVPPSPWTLRPPRRPRLQEQPWFNERFHIEESRTDQPDREFPSELAWEFDYWLRPRDTEVAQIPPLRFVYFNPAFVPEWKGYMTTVANDGAERHSIPIYVRAKPAFSAAPLEAAPDLFVLPADTRFLDRPYSAEFPSLVVLGLLVVAPPLACAAWYVWWRRRYPDAARLARLRRGRAARTALKGLRGLAQLDAVERGTRSASIMTTYLRHRLDLPAVEPAPAEVAAHLEHTGVTTELADKTAAFFRRCDAVRFGPPDLANRDDLADVATQLIHALEMELWSRQAA
ncbi:MAG: hypothetical protein ACK4RK_12525 [Gemmataceae bacterium]